jgi:ubiquinone/menaquinone biosynthesis C-methylase UbiE
MALIRFLLEVFRTPIKIVDVDWRRREVKDVELYLDNIHSPHRDYLWSKIFVRYHPVGMKILEIGCGYGANLLVGANKYPNNEFVGVDISEASILVGQKIIRENGIENIEFLCMDGNSLPFENKKFDVSFTDALLLYLNPQDINAFIVNLIRITKNKIIFLEFHSRYSPPNGARMRDGWIYNMDRLLKTYPEIESFTMEHFPKDLRPNSRWKDFGFLITAHLRK